MYQPPHHREDRLEVQHALIRQQPLGLLVTVGAGGIEANLIPFTLDASVAPLGLLRCHMARANRQWQDHDPAVDALVVFQGPAAYVTPSWYATKAETGKVVPTWNYVVVQAFGRLRVIDDRDWLRAQVDALTGERERRRDHPWAVADAPEPFVDAQLKGIVGIEMPITRLEGKWKVSQNRPEADRSGVVAGLTAEEDPASAAMAGLVDAYGRRT